MVGILVIEGVRWAPSPSNNPTITPPVTISRPSRLLLQYPDHPTACYNIPTITPPVTISRPPRRLLQYPDHHAACYNIPTITPPVTISGPSHRLLQYPDHPFLLPTTLGTYLSRIMFDSLMMAFLK